MTLKHLCILLLAFVAVGTVAAQSEDIPVENDNQFPPEIRSESDLTGLDGSGDGAIEESQQETTESTAKPQLEDMQINSLSGVIVDTAAEDELPCPKPCVCNIEGGTTEYIVDCSGYGLTEFPSPLDARITTLKVQNNKLTELPKEISILKNLKVLNADKNSIMDLASGSISELEQLVVLKLSNNRLIEYPKDLKNSFSLKKLEELDLGGNDMRSALTSESFSNFKSLRKLTLPSSTQELIQDLCGAFKETLDTVCTESCSTKSYECPDTPQEIGEELLDATLPGMLAYDESGDPVIKSPPIDNDAKDIVVTEDTPQQIEKEPNSLPASTAAPNSIGPGAEIASRSRSKDSDQASLAKFNEIVNIPTDDTGKHSQDIKVGATTTDTKTGGVDKSVIGIIVAGMVLVVAGITIKKNWSSIKKRFSSSSRTPNERTGPNANGSAPEEVPLQTKSPV